MKKETMKEIDTLLDKSFDEVVLVGIDKITKKVVVKTDVSNVSSGVLCKYVNFKELSKLYNK